MRWWRHVSIGLVLILGLASPSKADDDANVRVTLRKTLLRAIQELASGTNDDRGNALLPTRIVITPRRGQNSAPIKRPPNTFERLRLQLEAEYDRLWFDKEAVTSSTGTIRVSSAGQLVNQSNVDNTETLKSNFTFRTTVDAVSAGGGFVWLGDGRNVSVTGGMTFGQAAVETKELASGDVTETAGDIFGLLARLKVEQSLREDSQVFFYADTEGSFLGFEGVRVPAEVIPGATVEGDTTNVTLRLFSVGGGTGLYWGPDSHNTVTAGVAYQTAGTTMKRDLGFVFQNGQEQRFDGEIKLNVPSPWAFTVGTTLKIAEEDIRADFFFRGLVGRDVTRLDIGAKIGW